MRAFSDLWESVDVMIFGSPLKQSAGMAPYSDGFHSHSHKEP